MTGADRTGASAGSLEIVVGVATYRRPSELLRALAPIVEQVHSLCGASARIVVVDNDPVGSARALVMSFEDPQVQYVHEPTPGIAAARNRALAWAGQADAIVFIDDDEVPEARWLQSLVDSWVQWGCAGVTGPVRYVFEGPAEAWVRSAVIFQSKNRQTGSVVPGASTANLLLDLHVLHEHEITFHQDFGISGGSDTFLTHTLRGKGEQIRWCQEAVTVEFVSPERSTRAYVTKRNIRTANTYTRVTMRLAENRIAFWRKRAELAGRGTFRILRGVAIRGFGLIGRNVALDARGAYDVGSGFGVLQGVLGKVRSEYERPIG